MVATYIPDEDGGIPEIENLEYIKHQSKDAESGDPFLVKGDYVKSIGGVNSNTKRRVSNEIRKRHRSDDGETESKKVEYHDVTGYFAFDVVTPPYNLDYLAKLYELSSPHYAAVNAKVSNIVGLGFELTETTKTKRAFEAITTSDKSDKLRKKVQKLRDDLLDRIDGWHEDDEFTETLMKVWKDYEATGNGYIEIGRRSNGVIGYVGHIPATTMRIRKQRDGFVQLAAGKAQFFANFGDGIDKETREPRQITNPIGTSGRPNEAIHIKKYAPSSTYYGVPDIVAAKNALAGNEFASRFNLDYFENKAIPRHLIILKGAKLGGTALRDLLAFFETNRGQNHRSMFIPLPPDTNESKTEFKIETVEPNVQDASFEKYRKANLSDILMAHRVPVSKVSVSEGISLAAARDADKTFKEQVCQPEQRVFEKKLNRILAEFTDAVQFKLNELTLTDADTQSKIDEREVRNGITLPNEIRVRKGLPGVKDGDVPGGPMTAQQIADRKATAQQSRARDAERSANAPDNDGEARQPQGEGRATA